MSAAFRTPRCTASAALPRGGLRRDQGKRIVPPRGMPPAGDSGGRVLVRYREAGTAISDRGRRGQSSRRHADVLRGRSRRAIFVRGHAARAAQCLPERGYDASVDGGPRAGRNRRRHGGQARHVGRSLCIGVEHGALRTRQADHALVPRQLSARGRRERAIRADQARSYAQHQFLHERTGDFAGFVELCGRCQRSRKIRGTGRSDGPPRAHLELPSAQQSVQFLQPDALGNPDLGP